MLDVQKLSPRYAVRRMDDSDADAVLAFCRENPLYYRYCGVKATREQVLDDLRVTPPGVEPSDKYYVGFYDGPILVAVLDLIDGYPEPDTAYIGFFMMNAALQGRGVGTGIVGDVCAYLGERGIAAVRLGIAEDNPQANHFWRKNDFNVVKRVPMDGWTALVAERKL